ncbi:MAG: hypothetical protein GEU95_00860 [Rhizobiales bacterium]|nr:hypothetical protein [Hyphomicrobiales bacterium]
MRNESDRDRITRTGRAALKRLDSDQNWHDWLAVGEAILIGRQECKEECGLADTNLPAGSWGGAYNRAFGEWLAKEKLDFDKGDRSRLLEVMDNLPAIETWRMTLTLPERRRLNHPSTVLRKWKAATQPKEPREAKPTLRDSVANLSEESTAKDREIEALKAHIAELEAAPTANQDQYAVKLLGQINELTEALAAARTAAPATDDPKDAVGILRRAAGALNLVETWGEQSPYTPRMKKVAKHIRAFRSVLSELESVAAPPKPPKPKRGAKVIGHMAGIGPIVMVDD